MQNVPTPFPNNCGDYSVTFLVDRRALAAQAVRTFASFQPEPGHKFNQLYHVYSQRFHREDFGEDEKFDPTVLPPQYLERPKVGDAFDVLQV